MTLIDLFLWFVGFVVGISAIAIGLAIDFKDRDEAPRNRVARKLWALVNTLH